MTPFRKFSIIGGWLVFAIAFLTYMLTLEPTTSLWDCPEFIATSFKLEVGHPPGTPLFFLINRIGAMFAGDTANVAYAINTLSALESALTIAFLFWSIAHLSRKIFRKSAELLSSTEVWATMAAAAVGSLAYAFTDTFWFSAVEAEVYALSSLFTAVVFWAMLRWDSVADEQGSERWLVLIAYLMGLSIGAHILNLLTIPALVFIYYFRKFPASPKKDLWKPAVVGIGLTGLFYILTPTVVSIGSVVDRWFVNGMSLPANSGIAAFIVVILAAVAYGIYRTHKGGKKGWNTILISVGMIVIGFSTYGVVLIRSGENTPMNSNTPNNPYALKKFLEREQYGSRPLISGQNFNSTAISYKYNDQYYLDADGKYKQVSVLTDVEYDPATTTLFPRMYDRKFAEEYKAWSDFKGRKVKTDHGGMVTIPTFGENVKFFLGYQVNNMYWRYFLWNFVGRQNDLQNDGPANGGWISGVGFIDEVFAGPQTNLPDEVAANKGRNTYYFLPLILGMVGLFYSLKKDGRGFLIVGLLFFMTGIAIIMYLNQTPLQPRERDYSYAASFYAFCIWIGLGALALFDTLRKRAFKFGDGKVAVIVAAVVSLSVPTVLAVQNWDDHNRSNRTIARDMGFNYLTGLLPNSVFINYGDNDTFPVWYAQEVEGVRTDVRVMNQSYIGGDWYIEQMRHKAYEGEALPLSLPRNKYFATTSSPLFYVKETPRPGGGIWTANEVMQVVNSEERSTKAMMESGQLVDFIPSATIALPVNKENVLKSGIVSAKDAHLIEDTVYIKIKESALGIGEMVLLDLITTSDWTRPIYFSSSSGPIDLGLINYDDKDGAYSYLQNDGAGFRLVPIKTPITKRYGAGRVDTELLYDNLMNKFSYGGLKNGAYVDQFVYNALAGAQFRATFARLADSLSAAGDTLRAVAVLDRAMEELPVTSLRRDEMLINIASAYWNAGQGDKGDSVALDLLRSDLAYAEYYNAFKGEQNKAALSGKFNDIYNNLVMLYQSSLTHKRSAIIKELEPYFQTTKEQ